MEAPVLVTSESSGDSEFGAAATLRRPVACACLLRIRCSSRRTRRHLRIALESEDVRSHAIEEPAIVRDDDGASGEILQRFLQRPQGVDVEIVRRLVEQQNVGGSRNEKPRLAPGLSS